jgi:lipoprotein-releasing system permease protein
MFRPLELYIGLRYLRTRRASRFVSFISLVSLLGVAVGVAALIVVLSVMNGFEQELRARLLNLTSHAVVTAPGGRLRDWQPLLERIEATPGVAGAAPFVEVQAMLAHEGVLKGTLLRGIDPDLEACGVPGRAAPGGRIAVATRPGQRPARDGAAAGGAPARRRR